MKFTLIAAASAAPFLLAAGLLHGVARMVAGALLALVAGWVVWKVRKR